AGQRDGEAGFDASEIPWVVTQTRRPRLQGVLDDGAVLPVVVRGRGLAQAGHTLVLERDQRVVVGARRAVGDAELVARGEVEALMRKPHAPSPAWAGPRAARPRPAPPRRSGPDRSPAARCRARLVPRPPAPRPPPGRTC